ncbi:helix-turn-helix transcriptional regulator [Rubripirellula obstinata]|uniref:helix-turn-helix transcriptional regulator n=1 Tax=Rubripirellula obstinata TaxID=406547 RepID=UPI0012F865AA|nr:helix-turn-helix transcriptional regulator [Rubripirellula obstinata]
MADFISNSRELHRDVLQHIADHSSAKELVEPFCHAVYVKAADGRILLTNRLYEELFAGDRSSVGRLCEAFLDQSILTASRASDDLILAGCSELFFSHAGRDAQGRAVKLETFKGSLLGAGHPNWAILGITSLLEITEEESQLRLQPLSQSWRLLSEMKNREQQTAVLIAKGTRVKEIAAILGVSEKTVDNTRANVLEKLSLDQPADLIKLMVRIQDNGFADFGL